VTTTFTGIDLAALNAAALPVRAEDLPEALRARRQWVLWRYTARAGNPTKEPVNARSGALAKTDDPSTWCSFEEARAACEEAPPGTCGGIGFVFSPDDPFCGFDFDKCIDPSTGEVEPWGYERLDRLNSYTERSPSGTGYKTICEGRLPLPDSGEKPKTGRKKTGFGSEGNGAIEAYHERRFFALTGHRHPDYPAEPQARQEVVSALYHETWPAEAKREKETPGSAAPLLLDDEELIEKAEAAENGAKFRALWDGDTSDYNHDDSAADLALCCLLAFWTGHDTARLDRLFRRSGLYRKKWERKDYRDRTIKAALERVTDRFSPSRPVFTSRSGRANANGRQATPEEPEPDEEDAEDGDEEFRGPQWPEELAGAAYHGFAGELVEGIKPYTEASPVALLVQTLATYGSAVGRAGYFSVGATRHGTNLNAVLVGRTAGGRKGTSLDEVLIHFNYADPFWFHNHIAAGLSSGEGLIYAVRDATQKTEPIRGAGGAPTGEYRTVITDPGVQDKRLLVTETEFGAVLRVLQREGNTLSAILRQAWDTGHLRVLNKNTPLQATGAHISLVGHITKDELLQRLDQTDAWNGLLNRFLWAAVHRWQRLPTAKPMPLALREKLTETLKDRLQWGRGAVEAHRDEEAEQFWREEVYDRLEQDRAGLWGAVTSRAAAQVTRLSLVYALLDRSYCVKKPHLEAALTLWRYCEASAAWIFGQALADRTGDAILGALRQAPEGLTRTEISALFGRHKTTAAIGATLARLAERGMAYCSRTSTGGRPRERWYAV
jgi:hypothetical protein